MRIKFFVAIFYCFFSITCFSQTKTLLHSFQRHFEVKDRNTGQCFSPSYIKGWQEDFLINLFSDSTFIIEYNCSGKSDGYHGYIKNEIATGRFYSINDSVFLIRNISKEFRGSNQISTLDGLFNSVKPLRILYANDSLLFYYTEATSLAFTKTSILNWYKKGRQLNASIFPISPQLSNITPSF